ncbi:LytR/AlgR family response regulator transcription factor [Portibacter lacus]|uniref:HTH LytTR-type domain-containing protein n=1 Tax=Portibacter lacus TaxID=1099794 RepID=A0AA37WDZ8_9BACT|nr:LytTR family DNA-binding domain-containing protein [Portibacter lacus]GLR16587.1 hypothetical protein GCM10007940_12020 [Portibacter lacus]
MKMKEQSMKILIPTFSTLEVVAADEIICIHAADSYSQVELIKKKKITSTKGIGQFAKELENQGFFQCHKSHLVNLSKLVRYHKEGQAEMVDGRLIPVARRRKEEFLDQIKQRGDFTNSNFKS